MQNQRFLPRCAPRYFGILVTSIFLLSYYPVVVYAHESEDRDGELRRLSREAGVLESRGRSPEAFAVVAKLFAATVAAARAEPDAEKSAIQLARATSHMLRLGVLASVNGETEAAIELLSRLRTTLPDGWFRGRLELELRVLARRLRSGSISQDELDALESRAGFVRDWLFIGPFDNERGAGFRRAEPPETVIDVGATYPGKVRDIRWRELPVAIRDVVDFAALMHPGSQCLAYALTSIWVEEPTDVSLRLGCDDGIKVWLNDALVHSNEVRRPIRLDQTAVGARLAAGWNKLLVKVTQREDQWGFALRLTRPDGSWLSGYRISAEREHLQKLEVPEALESTASVELGAIAVLEKAVDSCDDADLLLDLSFLHQLLHPDDEALLTAHRFALQAWELDRDNPNALYLAAVTAEVRASMRPELEENKKRNLLEAVIRQDPRHVQALLTLARYYTRSIDAPRKAWNYARRALAASAPPGSELGTTEFDPSTALHLKLPVLVSGPDLYYMEWLRRRGFVAQAESYLDDIVGAGGDIASAPTVILELAERAVRRGQIGEAVGHYRHLLENNFSDSSLRNRLVDLLLRFGRNSEALEVLEESVRLNPFDIPARMRAASIHEGREEFEAALLLWRESVRINPDRVVAVASLAKLLRAMDRTDEARTWYQRCLELDPNNTKVRRYLDFLQNVDREFHSDFPVDLESIVNRGATVSAQNNEPYSYLLRRTLVKVNRDGRASRYHQILVKVLNDRGLREFDIYPISFAAGEQEVRILTNRVHHVDGTKTDGSTRPQAFRTRRSRDERQLRSRYVDFPPLSVGDIVEIAYRLDDRRQSFFGDYFGTTFLFQETDFVPVAESTFVLIAPPDRELHFHRRNGAPERKVLARDEERVVWEWTMTGLSGVERESGMPPVSELVPSVQVSTYGSWDEFAQWWWNLIREEGELTPDLVSLVEDLSGDVAGRDDLLPKFYDFVVSDVRYVAWEFGVHGYKPYNATTIVARRFGDCKDKAILLNTLLAGVEIESYPAILFLGNTPRNQDLTLPLVSHFNHCISYVPAPGGEGRGLFLDGTTDVHGSRNLPGADRARTALVVKNGKADLISIPEFEPGENESRHDFRIELSSTEPARLRGTFGARGDLGAKARRLYRNPDRSSSVIESALTNRFGTTSILSSHFSDMKNLETPVFYEVDAFVDGILALSGTQLSVSAVHFAMDLSQYGGHETRKFDLMLPPPFRRIENTVFVLPEDLQLLELPEGVSFDRDFGSYTLRIERRGDREIEVYREIELKARRVLAADYPAFREFCLLVAQAEERRLRFAPVE